MTSSEPVPGGGESPLVSVIIVFRNAERFLDEAVGSILGQTFPRWELILVDDGSTDGGPAIGRAYQQRLAGQVRLLQHPGGAWRGIAASRNLGMREARGRYIAFLDADDAYEPRRLESHVAWLEREPSLGVVLSPDLYWRSWQGGATAEGDRVDRVVGPAVTPGRIIKPPALIVATLLTRGAPMPATCSITFRATALGDIGGIPEEFRGYREDQVLVCKLLLEYPVVVLEECLARYRQHAESLTSGNVDRIAGPDSPARAARRQFLEWLRDYLTERRYDVPDLSTWVEGQLTTNERLSGPARKSWFSGVRSRVQGSLLPSLPMPVRAWLSDRRHRARAWRVRMKVMRRIRQSET
jgi:glycosyltransferase involved in cell wall biosynthesis